MLSLLCFCGLRRGELLGVRFVDVDLERKILLVNGATSKSGRDRKLPIQDFVLLDIEDYLQERLKRGIYTTPFLFASLTQDRGLSKNGLKHWVERLNNLSKVKFHLHQFRHTFASNLAAERVTAPVLQRLMGHTDLRMTDKYLRSLDAEDLRPAANSLSFDKMR